MSVASSSSQEQEHSVGICLEFSSVLSAEILKKSQNFQRCTDFPTD